MNVNMEEPNLQDEPIAENSTSENPIEEISAIENNEENMQEDIEEEPIEQQEDTLDEGFFDITELDKIDECTIKSPYSNIMPKHPSRILFSGSSNSGKTNLEKWREKHSLEKTLE